MVIFEVFFALICKWLEQLFCYMSIMGSLSRICGTFKVKGARTPEVQTSPLMPTLN